MPDQNQTPSPAAMRAARAIIVYSNGNERDPLECRIQDAAEIIDRETGCAEMREVLDLALMYIPESTMHYSEGDHGDRVYLKDRARALLKKE